MSISELIEELEGYKRMHGDIEVLMMIDLNGGQYEAPIRDTALSAFAGKKQCILVYEEDAHSMPSKRECL